MANDHVKGKIAMIRTKVYADLYVFVYIFFFYVLAFWSMAIMTE